MLTFVKIGTLYNISGHYVPCNKHSLCHDVIYHDFICDNIIYVMTSYIIGHEIICHDVICHVSLYQPIRSYAQLKQKYKVTQLCCIYKCKSHGCEYY